MSSLIPLMGSRGKMVVGSSRKAVSNQLEGMRKICALVVDDDPMVRRIHGKLLIRHGLETDGAENGKEAVDLFLSGKTYDLVVMDMEMPIMDGPKATEELRAMGVSSMIVGVTARSMGAEKEAFIGAGLDACWEKPLNAERVVSMIEQLVKKSH